MNGDEEPVVKVTLGKIYDKLLEVDKKVDPIPAAIVDHETRLRALERQMWKWMGASAVVATIVSALIAAFVHFSSAHP